MTSANKHAFDWHCEEHDTYGWRGDACKLCPEAPSELPQLRTRVAELESQLQVKDLTIGQMANDVQQLQMSLADTEALELGTGEVLEKARQRVAELEKERDAALQEVEVQKYWGIRWEQANEQIATLRASVANLEERDELTIRHAIEMLHAIGLSGAEAEERWKEMK